MKKLFVLFLVTLFLVACGGMTKEEKDEMNDFQDSIKKDTASINSSVDAANDFLNDSTSTDSLAEKPIE
ncbi:MAG: hypothetical protein JXR53_00600 [Bacteroidales bacterium]|nr:hypothetical protein [Bacteroidales bacterium]